MAREILFKAKRIDNGEWMEGYVFDDGCENGRIFVGVLEIQEYKGSACDDWDIVGTYFYEVDPSTICQYTGLTDDSGAKIWENDVVFIPYEDENFKVSWDSDSARFALDGDGLTIDFDNMYGYECEVIGNIFDNMELLEEE